MWFIYALISGFSAACMAFLINAKLRHQDPLLSTTLFCIAMTIMLIIASLFLKKFDHLSSMQWKDLGFLCIVGFVSALGSVAYLFALQQGPLSAVIAIDRLSILYVILMTLILFGKKPSLTAFIGAVFMIVGCYLISKFI